MPACPECGFWSNELRRFSPSVDGVYYCIDCWGVWDSDLSRRRVAEKSVIEDRVPWYSIHNSLPAPTFCEDLQELQSYQSYFSDSFPWLEIDVDSLTWNASYCNCKRSSHERCRHSSGRCLTGPIEVTSLVRDEEATVYPSLKLSPMVHDEFEVNIHNSLLDIGEIEHNFAQSYERRRPNLLDITLMGRRIGFHVGLHLRRGAECRKQRESAAQRQSAKEELKKQSQAKQKEAIQLAIKKAQIKKQQAAAAAATAAAAQAAALVAAQHAAAAMGNGWQARYNEQQIVAPGPPGYSVTEVTGVSSGHQRLMASWSGVPANVQPPLPPPSNPGPGSNGWTSVPSASGWSSAPTPDVSSGLGATQVAPRPTGWTSAVPTQPGNGTGGSPVPHTPGLQKQSQGWSSVSFATNNSHSGT